MNDTEEPELTEPDPRMRHWRLYFDSKILRVWHLLGKSRVVQIIGVRQWKAAKPRPGQNSKQLAVYLAGIKLPLLLNVTNSKQIAMLHGMDPLTWPGKWIELYPTTTSLAGETVDCIRVRPRVPDPPRKPSALPESTAVPHSDPGECIEVEAEVSNAG